jgi:hypothetical protein
MAITVQQIIAEAKKHIGYSPTSGINKFSKCTVDVAWCAGFISGIFENLSAVNLLPSGRTLSCGVMATAFEKSGQSYHSGFKAGDIVFFHWSNEKSDQCSDCLVHDHVGIIIAVNGNTLTTIEGNTGNSTYGEVKQQTRYASQVSCVGRPKYGSSSTTTTVKNETAPNVTYRVRTAGKWLPEVKNLNDYAGKIGYAITDVAIKVDKGSIKYRVHSLKNGWLGWITGYDINNSSKYAGNGTEIDAVEIIYYTDTSKNSKYYFAKYRVSPVSKNYYDWQLDALTTDGMDGYAGCLGKSIDRLQITLE